MKINFQVMMSRWDFKYNLLFKGTGFACLFFLFSISGFSQELKKTFSKEIKVTDQLTVLSNVPTSLLIELKALTSVTNNTKFGYIIQGKQEKDRLNIHKDYVIETWNQNVIRQEVEVIIKASNQTTAQTLMDAFEIELSQNETGEVAVDANMNLIKFTLKNSRFKGDDCRVLLNGGKEYRIEYLELKTRLFIPKSANLKIQSTLNHTLRLDDLDGDLDLDIQYGEIYGKKIKTLNAKLRFCYNVIFDEAEKVNASATNSYLKVGKVKDLHLGEYKLAKEPFVNEHYKDWLKNNSSMNLYDFRHVDRLVIYDTANDEFKIGEVNNMEVRSSIFSNYKILKINNNLNFTGKSGDISIAEVSKGFQKIDIKNTLSQLNINVADDINFDLYIFDNQSIELKLPSNAQLSAEPNSSNSFYKIGKDKSTGKINIRCYQCELDIWN